VIETARLRGCAGAFLAEVLPLVEAAAVAGLNDRSEDGD